MKNTKFKRFFAALLSLLFVVSTLNFRYVTATDYNSIAVTFTNFKNTGLSANSEVSFDIMLNVDSDESDFEYVGFQMYVVFDTDKLTPVSCVGTLEGSIDDTQIEEYRSVILNDAKLGQSTMIACGEPVKVGSATFKLTNALSAGSELSFSIDTADDCSFIKTTGASPCNLTPSTNNYHFIGTHALTSCQHSSPTPTAAKEANCTEAGNNAYWYCSECGKYFRDAECTTETTVADQTTQALGHNLVKVDAKDATCTEDGNNMYYECSRCGALFSAETGTSSLATVPIISATGHTWDEGTVTTEATYLSEGEKTYTCTVCGETKTESIPKLTHNDPNAGIDYWGTRQVLTYGGKEYEIYVDENGKTSALVTGNDKTWLREESYDPDAGKDLAAWYMLDNTSGEFEAGSRFSVQWLNNKDNPIEFLTHFNNIDQTIRDRIDSDRVWIFLVNVTKPDGTKYTTLSQDIPLYIQMGTDWDYKDIKAIFISQSGDEEVYASYLDMEGPEGTDEFAKLTMKHFSPYAIYDHLTDEEKAVFDTLTDEQKTTLNDAYVASQDENSEETASSNQVKTGDDTLYIVLMSLSSMIIAGLYLEICMKKRKN